LRVNERISSFLGLNNLLDPASAEYKEGMAYSCDNARINDRGLWTGKPTTSGTVSGTALSGGAGQRQMVLGGSSVLATTFQVATESPNGAIYYLTGAMGSRVLIRKGYSGGPSSDTVTQAMVAAPTLTSVVADASGSSQCRIEDGIYYYMVTDYDDTIKRESLPSVAREEEFDSTSNTRVLVTTSALVSGQTRRVYRTKRVDSASGVYNAPNIFYFIGEISTGTTFEDFRSDEELSVEYEGRGTVKLDADFIVSHNDRMLYFKDNELWWSSSGRPEEVAQKYSISYYPNTGGSEEFTLDNYPKLYSGYGEAKVEISELAGATIKGAIAKDKKLWIWTDSMMGYLTESRSGEGYLFKIHRKGVGAINQFALQSCERGIFGFDGRGMWLLDNSSRVRRLTDGRVDLSGFAFASTNYGVWCPNLNEYWMCEASGDIVAYQADRDIFAGGYTGLSSTAGCSWYDDTGAWGLIGTGKVVEGEGEVSLTFYLGQTSPTTIKQRIAVEAIQTASGTMTVNVGAGASKGGCTLETTPESATTTGVRQTTSKVGRMIKVVVTLNASSSTAGISTINYRYEPIEWSEEDGR